jgi:hypothetical protein
MESSYSRLCTVCGERIFTFQDDALCGNCRIVSLTFVWIAGGRYDGGAPDLKSQASAAAQDEIEVHRIFQAYA